MGRRLSTLRSTLPPETQSELVTYDHAIESGACVEIHDAAMEPRFHDGDTVVFNDVMPEPLALSEGKFVVARVEGCEGAMVRLLRIPPYLGEDFELRPLNYRYPVYYSREHQITLLGLVTESWHRLF